MNPAVARAVSEKHAPNARRGNGWPSLAYCYCSTPLGPFLPLYIFGRLGIAPSLLCLPAVLLAVAIAPYEVVGYSPPEKPVCKRNLMHHRAADNLSVGLYRRRASNPKDMAYGVWAVLQQRGAVDLPKPDHGRETHEVYHHLTVQLLSIAKSLDVLYIAAATRQAG